MFWLGFAVGGSVFSVIWFIKCQQVEDEIHREYEIMRRRGG